MFAENTKKIAKKIFGHGIYGFMKRNIRTNMMKIKFRDKKGIFYCPCCNTRLKEFIPFDYRGIDEVNNDRYVNNDVNVVCPVCCSLPRHRIAAEYLSKQKLPDKVYIVGSMLPEEVFFYRKHVKIKTVDLFKWADYNEDLTKLTFSDASVPMIFCYHVLEHVPDYEKALSEIYRVLENGKMAVIAVPLFDELEHMIEDVNADENTCMQKFGQKDHFRIFGRDFKNSLIKAGFDVEIIDILTMPKEIKPVIGPGDYDSNQIFVCRKQG